MSAPLHNTFTIERTYSAAPARVFAAFADPAKKRRWYGEADNHAVEAFEMDFRVGGAERATYRLGPKTPFPGTEMVNDGAYYDIVPNERIIVGAAMMFGGRRITVSLITFEF
ncbi:SRPBCC domain-containing protein, partial [Phenylobacterium sp.]|uniref:SRPBCC domain-containing protein n=1 Tax=Phenylobacterium sp. TaxID=1871053 RepID=UPI002E367807